MIGAVYVLIRSLQVRSSRTALDPGEERYHIAFQALRRTLGRAGVTLLRAQQHESVRLILNRMDRLRGVRARR